MKATLSTKKLGGAGGKGKLRVRHYPMSLTFKILSSV